MKYASYSAEGWLAGTSHSDIQVIDKDVSRHHCVLVDTDQGDLLVLDLSSRNGTHTVSERITTRVMKFGEEIQVGSCKFVLDEVADKDDVWRLWLTKSRRSL